MNKKSIITWVLIFAIFFLVSRLFSNGGKEVPPEFAARPVGIMMVKNSYTIGEEVAVKVKNNTASPVKIPLNCPGNPFEVLFLEGTQAVLKKTVARIPCDGMTELMLKPQEETQVSMKYWNNALFGAPGRYKIQLSGTENGTAYTAAAGEFTIEEAGILRRFFRTAFYQPLYNTLIAFISIAPARDLGVAIILLTIVIRLILLVPSQRAIVSQRKLQELQPKLEKLKKTYAGNQERISQETMKLWKEHKVNPFGSCLPLLIQFPVLIALFYVIQNGLNPDNAYLLYSPLQEFDFTSIHTNFLGILDLTKANKIILPLLVGLLQFLQMKLAMVNKGKEKKQEQAPRNEMETANRMLIYMMPIMIAVFTASTPAGVGLYWGISTLFGLGQQIIANKKAVASATAN